MKSNWLYFFFILLWTAPLGRVAWAASEVGPEKAYYLVADLKNDWLTYSNQYKNYVPFSRGVNEAELSVSLLLDTRRYRRYELLLSSARENYLFVEGALQTKLAPDEWLVLDVDSLRQVYRKDQILLTLYGSSGIENKTAMIGHARHQPNALNEVPFAARTPIINIKPLAASPFRDFSVLVMLVLLVLTLFTYTVTPTLYRRFVSPADFVDLGERNDFYQFNRPYSPLVVQTALAVSIAMAYILLFLSHFGVEPFYYSSLLSESESLARLLFDLAKFTILFMVLFFMKYLLMSMVGGVLNLGRAISTHYIKALQISYLFYGLCMLLFFGVFMQMPVWFETAKSYIVYGFVAYYAVRFVILYVFNNYSGRFTNLYLFAYLCVTEIIPLIIGVKFAT